MARYAEDGRRHFQQRVVGHQFAEERVWGKGLIDIGGHIEQTFVRGVTVRARLDQGLDGVGNIRRLIQKLPDEVIRLIGIAVSETVQVFQQFFLDLVKIHSRLPRTDIRAI